MDQRLATTGSRSLGYLMAGLVATVPVWLAASVVLGFVGGAGAVLTGWCVGVLWLVKKRQDDPGWDRRQPRTGQR